MTGSREMQTRIAPPIFGVAYAGLIALASIRGYFLLVDLPWFITQISYGLIIIMSAVWVFYSGEMRRIHICVNVMLVQMLPNLIILVWSLGLWIARQEPLGLILRGSSMLIYELLLLTMVISAVVLFGERAIEWTSVGFVLANTLILLDVMRRNGIFVTIQSMVTFLVGLGSQDNAISVQLEVQDITFGIAILLLYYLVAGKGKPRRILHIILLGFYFLLGFKRILFPAVGVGILYFLLIQRLPEKYRKAVTLGIGICLIAICLGYVVLIRTRLWFDIAERFGIDLMGRKRLYAYMEEYYGLSPTYLGLEALEKTGNRRLHSDVLRLYIELGMPVFLLWCAMTFILISAHLEKHYSMQVAAIYMSVTLLMFVTFLTDNTLEKYCPQIAWHLLPLVLAEEERERLVNRLRNRKPLEDIGKKDPT